MAKKPALGKSVARILAEQKRQTPMAFALREAGEFMADLMRFYLASQGLEDSRIIDAITVEVNTAQGMLSVVAPPYATWVESGRKPYGKITGFVNTMPPNDVIFEWVKRKRIKGRNRKTGKFITNAELVWRIRRMIARRGIPPRPFILPAIDEGLPKIDEFVTLNWDIAIDNQDRKSVV